MRLFDRTAVFVGLVAVVLVGLTPARGQPFPSTFVFQGVLRDLGVAETGQYDFRLTAFELSGSSEAIETVELTGRSVENGLFAIDVPGSLLNSRARWVEVAVRESGSGGAYTALEPRIRLGSTPFALAARDAGATLQDLYDNDPQLVLDADGSAFAVEIGPDPRVPAMALGAATGGRPLIEGATPGGRDGPSWRIRGDSSGTGRLQLWASGASPATGRTFELLGDSGAGNSALTMAGQSGQVLINTAAADGDSAVFLPEGSIGAREVTLSPGLVSNVVPVGDGPGLAVASATINAPGPGYVLAIATYDHKESPFVEGVGSQPPVNAQFAISLNPDVFPEPATRLSRMAGNFPIVTTTGSFRNFAQTMTRLFEVEEAGPLEAHLLYTSDAEGRENGGFNGPQVRRLTLLYIPTAYGPTELVEDLPEARSAELAVEMMAEPAAGEAVLADEVDPFPYLADSLPERAVRAISDAPATVQGVLTENGDPATASADVGVVPFDDEAAGVALGPAQIETVQPTQDGVITLKPEIAGVFDGDARWLELTVDPLGAPGLVDPRLPVAPVPFADQALVVTPIDLQGAYENGRTIRLSGQTEDDALVINTGLGASEGRRLLSFFGGGQNDPNAAFGAILIGDVVGDVVTLPSRAFSLAARDSGEGTLTLFPAEGSGVFSPRVFLTGDVDGLGNPALDLAGDRSVLFSTGASTEDAKVILPADSINAFERGAEMGVASAYAPARVEIPGTGLPGPAVLSTMEVPAPGYVIAIMTTEIDTTSGGVGNEDEDRVLLAVSLDPDNFPQFSIGQDEFEDELYAHGFTNTGSGANGSFLYPGSVHGVFEVPAGPISVYGLAAAQSDGGGAQIEGAIAKTQLVLIYVPNAYGFVEPTGSAVPARSVSRAELEAMELTNGRLRARLEAMRGDAPANR